MVGCSSDTSKSLFILFDDDASIEASSHLRCRSAVLQRYFWRWLELKTHPRWLIRWRISWVSLCSQANWLIELLRTDRSIMLYEWDIEGSRTCWIGYSQQLDICRQCWIMMRMKPHGLLGYATGVPRISIDNSTEKLLDHGVFCWLWRTNHRCPPSSSFNQLWWRCRERYI